MHYIMHIIMHVICIPWYLSYILYVIYIYNKYVSRTALTWKTPCALIILFTWVSASESLGAQLNFSMS